MVPSRTRYGVLGYLCALAFVLYIDRICIAQAASHIQYDLSLSNYQMGFVFAAFTVAYALFEVPTGRMGDRYGSKRVLIRIVLWWSAFTALTGAVWKFSIDSGLSLPWFGSEGLPLVFNSFLLLLLVRFLFGAGEAGAMPNIARVLAGWFPRSGRGRAQSLITTATLIGGAVAPPATALLIGAIGWRPAFVIFGLLGVAWSAAFALWYRDNPAQHPRVNAAELSLIQAEGTEAGAHHQPIPWGRVLVAPNTYLLGGVITCTAFLTYMFFSWYPAYLERGRGVSSQDAGWLAGLVLGGGAIGALTGGLVHDYLIRRFSSRNWTRRLIGFGNLVCASLCVAISPMFEPAWATSLSFALASFFVHVTLPTWWMTAIEFSGKHVGALFGLLNSIGAIGAVTSQIFLGWFTDYRRDHWGAVGRDQWDPAFWVYAGVVLVGSLGWLLINPVRKVEEEGT